MTPYPVSMDRGYIFWIAGYSKVVAKVVLFYFQNAFLSVNRSKIWNI